jgi:hypothetical protein
MYQMTCIQIGSGKCTQSCISKHYYIISSLYICLVIRDVPYFQLYVHERMGVEYHNLVSLMPQACNGHACVDFGCTHSIDWVVLKSSHLLVGFLLKI